MDLQAKDEGMTPELQKLESEADEFAANALIPPEFEMELYTLSFDDIPGFAQRVGVSQAIVLGRLQNEKRIPFKVGHQ